MSDTDAFFAASDEGIFEALCASYGDGAGGSNHPAVARFIDFMGRIKQSAVRVLDPNAPIAARLAEEELVMRFAWWLVSECNVASRTALQYVSTVQGWHKRWHGVGLAGNLHFNRVPEVISGLAFTHPFAGRSKLVRYGVRPQWLRLAIDRCLGGTDPDQTAVQANYAALFETCFAGLLRGCEGALNTNKNTRHKGEWNARLHSSRADIRTDLPGEDGYPFAALRCRNSKDRKESTRWEKMTRLLPGGGRYVDANRALVRMLERDPVPLAQRGTTPAFRDPRSGEAISVDQARQCLRSILTAIGLNGNRYGMHSPRIGGATAMFAEDADELAIKTMGVWSSDAFMAYLRGHAPRILKLARRGCSCDVKDDDHEADFIFDEDDLDE